MREKVKPRSIGATDKEWAALQEAARKECLTVSQYVRRLLRRELDKPTD